MTDSRRLLILQWRRGEGLGLRRAQDGEAKDARPLFRPILVGLHPTGTIFGPRAGLWEQSSLGGVRWIRWIL
jgi:hypothetical protein